MQSKPVWEVRLSIVMWNTSILTGSVGSKGMFMLKPGRDDPNDPPMAWWRPSQLKVVWPENLDPSKLILDLVRLPRVTCPARLSAETIINLAYNGVSHSVFEELMKEGLKKEVALLTTWSNAPGGAAALWDAVFRSGMCQKCDQKCTMLLIGV